MAYGRLPQASTKPCVLSGLATHQATQVVLECCTTPDGLIMPHGSRTAVWPAMARMHNPRMGECLSLKRALLCVLTKSATAASASAVTDRPSRARFRRARIKCMRLAMLSSRTKPSTVAEVLGSCLVTKARYLLARVMVLAGSTETSGHCARIAEGKPSISLTVMRGLQGCASDCCPCSIVGLQLGPHLLQGPQTLAQGPTRKQHGG